jgi:hypothetical protein
MSHTPGPWGVEPHQETLGESLVVISRGEVLALSPPAPCFGHPEQAADLANLTLMAAAPDLLRAALDALALLENPDADGFMSDQVEDVLHAAIAKAGAT